MKYQKNKNFCAKLRLSKMHQENYTFLSCLFYIPRFVVQSALSNSLEKAPKIGLKNIMIYVMSFLVMTGKHLQPIIKTNKKSLSCNIFTNLDVKNNNKKLIKLYKTTQYTKKIDIGKVQVVDKYSRMNNPSFIYNVIKKH